MLPSSLASRSAAPAPSPKITETPLPLVVLSNPGLQNPEMFNVIDSNGIERADRAFPMPRARSSRVCV